VIAGLARTVYPFASAEPRPAAKGRVVSCWGSAFGTQQDSALRVCAVGLLPTNRLHGALLVVIQSCQLSGLLTFNDWIMLQLFVCKLPAPQCVFHLSSPAVVVAHERLCMSVASCQMAQLSRSPVHAAGHSQYCCFKSCSQNDNRGQSMHEHTPAKMQSFGVDGMSQNARSRRPRQCARVQLVLFPAAAESLSHSPGELHSSVESKPLKGG
jgi:hypothetical protein